MKAVITKQGLNAMNQNRADGTVQLWIGYYGLAYIPEEERGELSTDTTELVEDGKGDVIYNLFQGGMTPVGFDTDTGKNSMAARIMNECMYTGSVISKFRYVLDDDDNNQLVVLKDYHPEDGDFGLREYQTFNGIGVEGSTESELPIPAPLYYMGEPGPYSSSTPSEDMPTVSCDTRVYKASKEALSGDVHADQTILSRAGKYDWFDSKDNVYTNEESDQESEGYRTLDDSWQYQSVSNFNRFHAPANTTGYAADYDPACRNLSKATKLFPISHYDVIDTKDDNTVSQVKYTVSVDLDSVFSKLTRRTNVYYDENGDKIEDPAKQYRVGFKFNRIGVYAVPVTLHAYKTGANAEGTCASDTVQMQIAGNEEPILYAILDLDSPIILSEGNTTRYDFSFQLDFGAEQSGVVNNAAIYYNLYEDDAITWYKNQLIANASASEAITSIGIQVSYLRKQLNDIINNNSYLCGLGDKETPSPVVVEAPSGGAPQNLINIGYIYHDDSFVDPDTGDTKQDQDINNNPLSDGFIERIDEILAAGGVPFVMYRCSEYELGKSPTATSWGTERTDKAPADITLDSTCSHCKSGASHTDYAIRFAPLVRIEYCSYYFANPVDAGWVIVLHEGSKIEFRKNNAVNNWHKYLE